ncbi:MAG: hypothetical protein US58_C0023G0002 [Candidatus Magasanikbacteria bacterium GW2011_GWA2_37_8]|uniref:Uncharacterized protein n=1 Tax=Candidatus Magasanikbacteria bacterium GW2011_GWA2_37_8 TaxID=1619036 RepID=A0A0G0HA96_9BACT|nr:MAG: hypothetical protein US58_C0023G0002 [Candidatus Magasanikbacteria bacterium GW2011_GWA2_37_8]
MLKTKILAVGFFFLVFLAIPKSAFAAGWCFCSTDLSKAKTDTAFDLTKANRQCSSISSAEACQAIKAVNTDWDKCEFFNSGADNGEQACKDALTVWDKNKDATQRAAITFSRDTGGWTSVFIPTCALDDALPPDSPCRNVSIFVQLLINVARYLFGIVGALALLFFIYGGFTMILSGGSAEKTKKGTQIIVAAVIGLAITFSAYLLVSFLGESLGVQTQFLL